MSEIDRPDAVDGRVVGEGGRGPSTSRAAPSATIAPQPGPPAPGQRRSVGREREVVLRPMRGEPAEPLSRGLGLPISKPEHRRQRAEAGLEGALKERGADPAGDELAAAMRRTGELSMEVEPLRAKTGRTGGPLARRRWR